MELFLKLEAGYLAIALFILIIALFVTTRSYMPKGAYKKGVLLVFGVMTTFISLHYYVTTDRMFGVEDAYNNGEKVICESRATRKVAQSVTIEKSNEWTLENHMFSSPNYSRSFFTARCIEHVPVVLPPKK